MPPQDTISDSIPLEELLNASPFYADRRKRRNEAAKRAADHIPVGTHPLFVNTVCSICYDEAKEPHAYICGHVGCKECLMKWQESVVKKGKTLSCPCCRCHIQPLAQHSDIRPTDHFDYANRFGRLLSVIAKIGQHAERRPLKSSGDFIRPRLTDIWSAIKYLTLVEAPRLPVVFMWWEVDRAKQDVHTFGGLLLEFLAEEDGALQPGSITRQQWLGVLQAACDSLDDGFKQKYGQFGHKMFFEWTTAVANNLKNVLPSKYGSRYALVDGTLVAGIPSPFIVPGDIRTRYQGMFWLLMNYVMYRQLQRYMEAQMPLLLRREVRDPVVHILCGPGEEECQRTKQRLEVEATEVENKAAEYWHRVEKLRAEQEHASEEAQILGDCQSSWGRW